MKKKSKKKMVSQIMILAGLAIILAAIGLELYNYPWRTIKGNNQEESSIADPTPIMLDEGEKDAIVIVETAHPTPVPTGEPPAETEAVLPGDEDEQSDQVYVYVQTGILKIPKLGVSVNILEGTGYQLNYGVGHVIGTAGLGQAGNCAIAGHRPHPFRYLDSLVSGDSVIIKFGDIIYTYSVFDSFDVLPDETWVLGAVKGEDYALTIITCTPYLVSSHRLIVRARLTDINGMTPSDYYALPSDGVSAEPTPSESPTPDIPEPDKPVSAEENEPAEQPDDVPEATSEVSTEGGGE